MTFLLCLLIASMVVVAWSFMADHAAALDWRRPDLGRGYPRTDVNQQWTVVDR